MGLAWGSTPPSRWQGCSFGRARLQHHPPQCCCCCLRSWHGARFATAGHSPAAFLPVPTLCYLCPDVLAAWGRKQLTRGLADTCFGTALDSIGKEKWEQSFLLLSSCLFYVGWPRLYSACHISVPSLYLCHASFRAQWLYLLSHWLLAQVLWGFWCFPFPGCWAMRTESSWQMWKVSFWHLHLLQKDMILLETQKTSIFSRSHFPSCKLSGSCMFSSPKLLKIQV